MKPFFLSLVASLISLLAIDGVWLSIMLKRFYSPRLATLVAETPNLVAAGVFYLIYAYTLSILVILPAVQQNMSYGKIAFMGGLFGLAAYATYDLTNQATLKNWPVSVTIVDLVWGTLLTALVSVLVAFVVRKLT